MSAKSVPRSGALALNMRAQIMNRDAACAIEKSQDTVASALREHTE